MSLPARYLHWFTFSQEGIRRGPSWSGRCIPLLAFVALSLSILDALLTVAIVEPIDKSQPPTQPRHISLRLGRAGITSSKKIVVLVDAATPGIKMDTLTIRPSPNT